MWGPRSWFRTSLGSGSPEASTPVRVFEYCDGQYTSSIPGPRELLKPMVRYVGNMHGNEPVGRELLNHFAETLLEGYGV